MGKKKGKRMYVSKDFLRAVKIEAANKGITMRDYTDILAKPLLKKNKRTKEPEMYVKLKGFGKIL